MWDWSAFFHYLQNGYLLNGAVTTLWLAVVSMAVGLICGLIAASLRISGNPVLSRVAGFYVWLFRGTPVLVQLVIIYTGLPQLGIKLDVVQSAILGLGINEGAYLAEIIRGGILGVPRGQFDAARSLGMTRMKTMRLVVFPQAFRIIIPPLGNSFNGLLKTSSLASVISMDELLRRTEVLIQVQFKVLEIFAVAALYYLVMTTAWGFIQDRIEAYFGRSVAPSTSVRRRGFVRRAVIDRSLLERDAQ